MADDYKGDSVVSEAKDLEGTAKMLYSLALEKIRDVVSSLPDDMRPGPDLFGLPWEAVVFSALLGLVTVFLFSYRFIHSIKSRLYASKERRMGQAVADLLEEKCKVLNTLSECKHKFEKLETALQNGGLSAQASDRENLEGMSKKLQQSNAEMKSEIERLQEELTSQSTFRKQQEEQLEELEETLKSLEEKAKERRSQAEQDKTTLKIHEINTERLHKRLQAAKEENTMLLESKAQLVREAEGWGERLSELEEEMRMCKSSHAGMLEDCANKDERIKSLTDCLLKLRDWDSDEENTTDASNGTAESQQAPSDFHQKHKVQQLIFAAKMSADLKAIEEDKNRVFAKLADEVKAKEDLQEGIEQLQMEKQSLESDSSMYTSEIQKLQQKLQIMTEMYQENELKLHRMLTVEERERSQKEEKLSKAGKKISLAAEELNNCRQRAKDLEEELEKTNQAYKNQIASHEKKAHDNWLAARAADRDLTDVKRENALLRQRLTDSLFKMELLEKDPYARDALARPPFRGERSPYGPSPLGRPPSETRTFLSPPTLMDGPPRLSPQPPLGPGGRVSRGQMEPPGGGPECVRSGPHSDSGSLSPTWDRESRGPAPPGLPPADPAMAYRRPLPGPFPLGLPRPPGPPEAYFGDKSDLFLGNSSGLSEKSSQDSLYQTPGDMMRASHDPLMRMGPPPDPLMRMGPPPDPLMRMGPPPDPHGVRLAPPMDPREPRFPRRAPYGLPDFYPRGPVGPPLGMRGMPPPEVFPRAPLPHPMGYPPLRPPPDGFLPGNPPRLQPDSFLPGPPPRPSPPGSEQPCEQPPSPHDVI
ncbi:cTAGE family member 5 isoform X4 [Brachyhypopomus gauderio]|uniref:cTAGE family member 5 isoform X4 n=1 Tax=Brachyhypopomus gauderio TaxID=698409 RepID=UPI0040425253